MTVEQLVSLILSGLEEDIIGTLRTEGNVITVLFTDGTERTIAIT